MGHHQGGQAQFVPQAQQQRQDLAAHRGVQGGHRLVGDDQFGVQDERARDHHALALAPRQLVRKAQEEPLRRPQPRPGQRRRPPIPARRPALRGSRSPSATASYTVCRGLSEPLGILEHQLDPPAVRLERPGVVLSGTPSKLTPPAVGTTRPSSARASVVLPQPDSPTRATISPGPDGEFDAVDRAGRRAAAPAGEGDVQAAGAEQRRTPGRSSRTPRRRLPTCTQAARWPGPAARSGWSCVAQTPAATGQRGWKAQPGGSADGSGGSPGRPRGARREAGSPIAGEGGGQGPAVGVAGRRRSTCARRALLDDRGPRTSPRAGRRCRPGPPDRG